MDPQQQYAVDAVLAGHNIAIVGTAGTGKSHLIGVLVRQLRQIGRRVVVTASTGMAAMSLAGLGATTLHSTTGILDGRFTKEELTQRILHNEACEDTRAKLAEVDTLIVDEASMISVKIFEQVETVCRISRDKDRLFGGLQLVMVLDPRQLPPVPDPLYQDDGKYCFESPLWPSTVPHSVQLDHIYRQTDQRLSALIEGVFSGNITAENHALLVWLSRPLPHPNGVIYLCSDNMSVDIKNRRALDTIPGPIVLYRAKDEGDPGQLGKIRAPKLLALKVGCPVMLLTNLNQRKGLVNGTRGKVCELPGDVVLVNFDGRMTKVQRTQFTRFDAKHNRIAASREQFPLSLCFALTIHKAQGLELAAVEVDAKNIFKSGMLGVAISRVKDMGRLRVVNYRSGICPQPPAPVREFLQAGGQPLSPDCTCCRPDLNELHDEQTDMVLGNDEDRNVAVRCDEEDSDETAPKERLDVLEESDHSDDPASLPLELPASLADVSMLLEQVVCEVALTDEQLSINRTAHSLTERLENLHHFVRELYRVLHSSIGEAETVKTSAQKDSSKILYMFLTGEEYDRLCCKLFATRALEDNHYQVAKRLVKGIREKMESELNAGKFPSTELVPQGPATRIRELDKHDVASGKVRYVGGSVIARLAHRTRQVVRNHLYDPTTRVIDHGETHLTLYRQLTGSQDMVSQFPESLREIAYKRRGLLTPLSDACYQFFLTLQKDILKLNTFPALVTMGSSMPGNITRQLLGSENVREAFNNALEPIGTVPETAMDLMAVGESTKAMKEVVLSLITGATAISEVREKTITLYMKSSNKRFRAEVMREMKVKKSEAHRRKIMKRKSTQERKTQGKQQRITVEDIEEENSCAACGNEYNEGQEWVACDGCSLWYERLCTDIVSDQRWDDITAGREPWFCCECQMRMDEADIHA